MNGYLKAFTAVCLSFTILSSALLAMEPHEGEKVTKQIAPKVSFGNLEGMAKNKHPSDFTGSDAVDSAIVRAYRFQVAQLTGSGDDLPLTFNNPALAPLVEKLEWFLRIQSAHKPSNKDLARFLKEIAFQREMEDINPLWTLVMHFRAAIALSKIGMDETDLFTHVPHGEVFFGLRQNNAWRNILSSYVGLLEYDNKGYELSDEFYSNLPVEAIESLWSATNKKLPQRVLYPCIGEGKFGISFLIPTLLQDIFPIAFPNQSLQGHGTEFSMFGFATHDFLHNLTDRRQYELMSYVLQEAVKYYMNGRNVQNFVKFFPDVASTKYRMVMGSLYEIYMNMVSKLIPYCGIQEFRKAMAGFFWIMHERLNFPARIYKANDLDKVIKTITKSESHPSGVSFSKEEYDSWESSFDPFETSPLTGQSVLSDDDMYKFVLKNMTMNQANCYKYQPFASEVSVLENEVVKRNVVRSKRFIDVKFSMRDGSVLVYTFPTLFHKWQNIDDNLGLLRYGGTKINKPILLEASDPRETAQTTLELVERSIQEHVDHFRTVALFFANFDPTGEGTSLAQRYFRTSLNLDRYVNQRLDFQN